MKFNAILPLESDSMQTEAITITGEIEESNPSIVNPCNVGNLQNDNSDPLLCAVACTPTCPPMYDGPGSATCVQGGGSICQALLIALNCPSCTPIME